MATIMVYEVNGKRFDDPQEALAYERLCEQVENITKTLTPRSKPLEDGYDYYKHDLDVIKDCFRKFCILCSKVIPSYKECFLQTANGDRHISHIGRILSDYNHTYPILQKTMFRFECISFENGYEFQQPYYVTHQEEFFKDMEKKKKDVSRTQEQINAIVHDSCVSFCKHCGCGVPRDTCTSLGTCEEHDEYRAAIRSHLMEKNKKK